MTHRIILEESRHYTHSIEVTAECGEVVVRAVEDEDGQPPRCSRPIGFPAHQAAAMAHAIQCAANKPPRSYIRIGNNHAADFNPFEPDALGALREAYAWIANPRVSTREALTYRPEQFNQLTEMLRRAIALAEVREAV